ncbi:hypothetical protein J3459_014929 [Metarhizium acridum]|uniref:Cell surface protein, putative n=1 Tax=Metarhizium acridum (strain CQMa 102) TaxID=655827 RepID=E9EE24_METAQ|nr:cell surface protein, putative [Metarhizium acridum CQMa 102]EFY85810.1 cell surface protein, putative [Metarhizium acridum CQMa 102]KAG8414202.1 hypothetical protein J3459_014929 [Metarhizium acridum]
MCPIGRKSHKSQPEYVAAGEKPVGFQPNAMGTQGQTPIGSDLPGPAPHTAGPHRHDILNKLDPTVDSRSGGAQILGPGVGASRGANAPSHGQGPTNTAAPGMNASGNTAHTAPPPGVSATAPIQNVPGGTYGPHSSRLANALDPRVDSDLDSSGAAYTHYRQGGDVPTANTQGEMYGAQQTRPVNTYDSRGDLDPNLRGAAAAQGQIPRAVHVGGTQPGPAPNTAGPHRTDFMNKLDPKLDSKRVI